MFEANLFVDLPEIFFVMLRKEGGLYKCSDYLSAEHQAQQLENTAKKYPNNMKFGSMSFPSSASACSSTTTSSDSGVNELWREKICEWSYQVIDHFDFDREIVSISLNYLDRFLSTRLVNKKIFQLAAMTSLYLAIKLYEPSTLRVSSLIELSRGLFKVEHVAAMEEAMLRSLSWHVHPPTSLSIIRHLLVLLPHGCCTSLVKHDIMEFSRFLTELSVCDYFFVTKRPSSIAYAALLNAIDGVDESRLSLRARHEFVQAIREVACLDCLNEDVEECSARLRDMYIQGGYHQQPHDEADIETNSALKERHDSCSPVCVSGAIIAAQPQHLISNIRSNELCSTYPTKHEAPLNSAATNDTHSCATDLNDDGASPKGSRYGTKAKHNASEILSRKSCKTATKTRPGGHHC